MARLGLSTTLAGTGSKLSESDLATHFSSDNFQRLTLQPVYFSYVFRHNKILGKSLHFNIITSKLQGWLHQNSLAKWQSTCDLYNRKEFHCLMNRAQDKGLKEEGCVISIRMTSVDGGCRVHGTSFIRMGSTDREAKLRSRTYTMFRI